MPSVSASGPRWIVALHGLDGSVPRLGALTDLASIRSHISAIVARQSAAMSTSRTTTKPERGWAAAGRVVGRKRLQAAVRVHRHPVTGSGSPPKLAGSPPTPPQETAECRCIAGNRTDQPTTWLLCATLHAKHVQGYSRQTPTTHQRSQCDPLLPWTNAFHEPAVVAGLNNLLRLSSVSLSNGVDKGERGRRGRSIRCTNAKNVSNATVQRYSPKPC